MSPAGHLPDGELIRLLDNELGAPDAVRAHLSSCPSCRERLSLLGRRQARLAALLRATAPSLGEPRLEPAFLARVGGRRRANARRLRAPVALRWAAAVAELAVGLSITPVRAWIVETAGTLWSRVAGGGSGDAPVPPALDDGPTEVRIRPPGPILELELVPPSGLDSVFFRREPAGRVVARLTGGGEGAEIVASDRGFRIVASAPGGRLLIGVPPEVERIDLSVRGEVRRRIDAAARTATIWSVELKGGG